jgi:hypothetical protein
VERLKPRIAQTVLARPGSLPANHRKNPESSKAHAARLGILTRHMSKAQLTEYCARSRKEIERWYKGHFEQKVELAMEVVENTYSEVLVDCYCGNLLALRWNRPCVIMCDKCKRQYDVRLAEKPGERATMVKGSDKH